MKVVLPYNYAALRKLVASRVLAGLQAMKAVLNANLTAENFTNRMRLPADRLNEPYAWAVAAPGSANAKPVFVVPLSPADGYRSTYYFAGLTCLTRGVMTGSILVKKVTSLGVTSTIDSKSVAGGTVGVWATVTYEAAAPAALEPGDVVYLDASGVTGTLPPEMMALWLAAKHVR